MELCGLKQEATGKGRRDIDDDLEPHDAQTFRLVAGTGLYAHPSLQFAMSVVMSGMSEPKVVHQLQVARVLRYVLQYPGETWLPGKPGDAVRFHGHGLGSGCADQEVCDVHC